MEIDWFTVTAQAINFLVLMAILRRLLYQPILGVIRQREAGLSERVETIARSQMECDQLAANLAQQTQAIDARAKEALHQAELNAATRHRELVAEAREELAAKREMWLRDLREELDETRSHICDDVARQVASATRRVLRDLASADLLSVSVERFFGRLATPYSEVAGQLIDKLRRAEEVTMSTSHPLNSEQQSDARARLIGLAKRKIEVRFDVQPELVLGVGLRVGGLEFAWSVLEYVSGLASELEVAIPQVEVEADV